MKFYPRAILLVEAAVMAFFGLSLLLSPIRVEYEGLPGGVAASIAAAFLLVVVVISLYLEDWFFGLSSLKIGSILGAIFGIVVGATILFALSELGHGDVPEGVFLVRTILLLFPIFWTAILLWDKVSINLLVGVVLIFLYIFKGTSVINEWTIVFLLAYALWGEVIATNIVSVESKKTATTTATCPKKKWWKPVVKIVEEVFRPGTLGVLGCEMLILGVVYFLLKWLLTPSEQLKLTSLIYPSSIMVGGFIGLILQGRFAGLGEWKKVVFALLLIVLLGFGVSSLILTPSLIILLGVCVYWLWVGWYFRSFDEKFFDRWPFCIALLGSILGVACAVIISLDFIWPVIMFLSILGVGFLTAATAEIVR